MKNPKQQVSQSRRKFIRDASVAGGIAAAAATAPGVALADAEDNATQQKPKDGYRLSKHILDYYKSAAS